jgi:hypothetical protein
MPIERHRSADACMKFHFGLHRTSRENFGGGLALRCDSTDLIKEIRLVVDAISLCSLVVSGTRQKTKSMSLREVEDPVEGPVQSKVQSGPSPVQSRRA